MKGEFKMTNLTLEQKDIVERITEKIQQIPLEKQMYLLGRVEEMANKKEETTLSLNNAIEQSGHPA